MARFVTGHPLAGVNTAAARGAGAPALLSALVGTWAQLAWLCYVLGFLPDFKKDDEAYHYAMVRLHDIIVIVYAAWVLGGAFALSNAPVFHSLSNALNGLKGALEDVEQGAHDALLTVYEAIKERVQVIGRSSGSAAPPVAAVDPANAPSGGAAASAAVDPALAATASLSSPGGGAAPSSPGSGAAPSSPNGAAPPSGAAASPAAAAAPNAGGGAASPGAGGGAASPGAGSAAAPFSTPQKAVSPAPAAASVAPQPKTPDTPGNPPLGSSKKPA